MDSNHQYAEEKRSLRDLPGRLHNGSRSRIGFTSVATTDRQLDEATASFGSGERQTEAAVGGRDARQHHVEPLPPGYRSPQEYILSQPPRHFNELNSNAFMNTLLAPVTSRTQNEAIRPRSRSRRASDPIAIRPLLVPHSSV